MPVCLVVCVCVSLSLFALSDLFCLIAATACTTCYLLHPPLLAACSVLGCRDSTRSTSKIIFV